MQYYLNSIRWRLAFSYAAIALLATFSLGFVLRTILRSYYDAQEVRYLQESAMRIGGITSQLIDANVPAPLIQDQVTSWSFFLQARVRIEDASRRMIADSGVPNNQKVIFYTSALPSSMSVPAPGMLPEDPSGSFKIQINEKQSAPVGASEQGDFVVFGRDSVGVTVVMPVDNSMYGLFDSGDANVKVRRSSQVVEQRIIDEREVVLGRLILSDGPAYGEEILNNVMSRWVAASIVSVLLAALAGWYFSDRITTPITALTQITSRMAAGDLSARADIESNDEMGKLGRSFNEMASQVEEMVATLRSFVSDAAHELHTPLTALQTNLELARDEKDMASRINYLSRAQAQSQRLEALVGNLLDLSRIEAVIVDKSSEPIDLTALLHQVGESYASRAEQADRILQLDLPGETIIIHGALSQIQRAVENLLENALKFTNSGGIISLSMRQNGDEVSIVIKDDGIGIPPDDMPNLFGRFHRGHNVSHLPGNGLGLAIVKAIVDAHGGNVEVQSNGTGAGSEFTITLPLLKK